MRAGADGGLGGRVAIVAGVAATGTGFSVAAPWHAARSKIHAVKISPNREPRKPMNRC